MRDHVMVPTALRAAMRTHGPRPAVVVGGRTVHTYASLDRAVGATACALRRAGVRPCDLVALCLPKSADTLVLAQAVWRVGAAFVPLDPAMPLPRLHAMLLRAAPAVVVAPSTLALPQGLPRMTVPDTDTDTDEAAPDLEPATPDAPAYVIFSSGSTGAPKAIVVPHRGLTAMLAAQIEAFGLRSDSRVLWLTAPWFDASISDIGTALLAGAALHLEAADDLAAGPPLTALMAARGITHVDLPPALLPLLAPEALPDCLQTIVFGGEACDPAVVRAHAARRRMICVYGPTEATICTSLTVCDPVHWTRPLLGHPLPDVRYHLDGEDLVIEGQTATGYLGDPRATAARFLPVPGGRAFRSGDRVCRDGEAWVFLGRLDRQVKLHGILVAPEEVEVALAALPGVRRAAVVPEETVHGVRLTAVAETEADPAALRTALAARLPAALVPQRMLCLARMPCTPTGKVDLPALKAWVTANAAAPVPPTAAATGHGAMAARLLDWCREALAEPSLTPADDLFARGADSTAVVRLCLLASRAGTPLSVREVYLRPRIADLAAALDAGGDKVGASLHAVRSRLPGWDDAPTCRGVAAARAASVLLTGATGTLGARLMGLPGFGGTRLYCLVRANDAAHARRRLTRAAARGGLAHLPDHVVPLAGDVTQPRLGLSADLWQTLAEEVDTVFHLAARVHVGAPFDALFAPQVMGTYHVRTLQRTGRTKVLHHVSSLAVMCGDGRFAAIDGEGAVGGIPEFADGYAAAKAGAELLVGEADPRLPTCVYRLGLAAVPPDGDGPHDLPGALAAAVRLLGCLPRNLPPAAMDLTHLHWMVTALAAEATHRQARADWGTTALANPLPLTREALADLLAAAVPGLAVVDAATFRARAEADSRLTAAMRLACAAWADDGTAGRAPLLFARGTGALAMPRGSALQARYPCPPPEQVWRETYAAFAAAEVG